MSLAAHAANAVGFVLIGVGAAIIIPGLLIAIPGLVILENTHLLIRISRRFDQWLDIRQELLEDD